jgi:hypothetical protein
MSTEFSAHCVNRIKVSANSAPLDSGGALCWWQTLTMFDSADEEIGRVTLFLTRPDVALPLGDQPPYWDVTTNPPAQLMDGDSPF